MTPWVEVIRKRKEEEEEEEKEEEEKKKEEEEGMVEMLPPCRSMTLE